MQSLHLDNKDSDQPARLHRACAAAQADLNLRLAHMSGLTFCHVAVHM